MTLMTASTAIGAIRLEYWEIILEEREVTAAWRRESLSLRETGVDMAVKISTDLAAALWKDSDIIVGWIPLFNNLSAAPNNAPQMTTTEVVPSPASTSCAPDKSTNYRHCVSKAGFYTHGSICRGGLPSLLLGA